MIEKSFNELGLISCSDCKFLIKEYCSLFNEFKNNGVDFAEIPILCPLPNFDFDEETIQWF